MSDRLSVIQQVPAKTSSGIKRRKGIVLHAANTRANILRGLLDDHPNVRKANKDIDLRSLLNFEKQ
jgi:hypothetical protein